MASLKAEKRRSSMIRAMRRSMMLFIMIALGYLVQVCVMPDLRIGRSTPLFTICILSVITICYGRIRAFWCGAVYGILFEVMQPTHQLIQLILFPAAALLCAVLFADKSMQQLEYERRQGKAGRNRNPFVRTVLCAGVNAILHESVNLIYIYLRESIMTRALIMDGLTNVLYTTLLTLVMTLPLRLVLGYPLRQVEEVHRHRAAL